MRRMDAIASSGLLFEILSFLSVSDIREMFHDV